MTDKSITAQVPPSIRYNNPGAINGDAKWVQECDGFKGTHVIGGGNPIAEFDTIEHGAACYYELLKRYRDDGAHTTTGIILRYGGQKQSAQYRIYLQQVLKWTGLGPDTDIPLTGDDSTLLKFAKAMFRYEAGRDIPWTDDQIIAGFDLVRGKPKVPIAPIAVTTGAGAIIAGIFHSIGAHPVIVAGVILAMAATVVLILMRSKS